MHNKSSYQSISLLISFFSAIILFTACDTAETNNSTVSLSFYSGQSLSKTLDDTIELDTVKILIRDIKIKNQSGNNEPNLKVGPFVVYLELSGMTTDFTVTDIPLGSYDRVRFSVHKIEASETPPDPEFKEGNDSSLRYSVIVKGKYNSADFIYKSRKSAHQDLKLETPIEVDENEIANLTITVDPFSWFSDGTTLLDPTDPANENDIDNNIKDSFKKCFRDDNHDGVAE